MVSKVLIIKAIVIRHIIQKVLILIIIVQLLNTWISAAKLVEQNTMLLT